VKPFGPAPKRGRLLAGLLRREQLSSVSTSLRFSARGTGIRLASCIGLDILSRVSRMSLAVVLIASTGGCSLLSSPPLLLNVELFWDEVLRPATVVWDPSMVVWNPSMVVWGPKPFPCAPKLFPISLDLFFSRSRELSPVLYGVDDMRRVRRAEDPNITGPPYKSCPLSRGVYGSPFISVLEAGRLLGLVFMRSFWPGEPVKGF